jgi:tagatose-1,6-bisphosphate aldolase non-catalytic subunit AgaZ/GatZ
LPARVLGHPLFLLLVGGVISALLVPMLTQRWQDHQRALDVQTSLVADMTQTTMTFLVAVNRLALGIQFPTKALVPAKEQWRRTDAAEQQFNIRGSTIAARLRTYYGDSAVTRAWQKVLNGLEDIWIIEQLWNQKLGTDNEALAFDRLAGSHVAAVKSPYFLVLDACDAIRPVADRAAQLVRSTKPKI